MLVLARPETSWEVDIYIFKEYLKEKSNPYLIPDWLNMNILKYKKS